MFLRGCKKYSEMVLQRSARNSTINQHYMVDYDTHWAQPSSDDMPLAWGSSQLMHMNLKDTSIPLVLSKWLYPSLFLFGGLYIVNKNPPSLLTSNNINWLFILQCLKSRFKSSYFSPLQKDSDHKSFNCAERFCSSKLEKSWCISFITQKMIICFLSTNFLTIRWRC